MNSTIEYITNFKDQFSYCKETDCIVAEISSFGRNGIDLRGTVSIISEKTGKKVDYRMSHIDYYGGSEEEMPEIGGWYFKPVDSSVKTKLLFIND